MSSDLFRTGSRCHIPQMRLWLGAPFTPLDPGTEYPARLPMALLPAAEFELLGQSHPARLSVPCVWHELSVHSVLSVHGCGTNT